MAPQHHQSSESTAPFSDAAGRLRRFAQRTEDPVWKLGWSVFRWALVLVGAVAAYAGKDYFRQAVAAAPVVIEVRAQTTEAKAAAALAIKKSDDVSVRLDIQVKQTEQTLSLLSETARAIQSIKEGQAAVVARLGDIQTQQQTDRKSIEDRLNAFAARQRSQ